MKRILGCMALLALAACSTGIVPTSEGKYMISTTSAAGTMGNPDSILADQYKQANDYCAKQNMVVKAEATEPVRGIPFVRPARATLQFRCVPPGNAASAP